MKKRYLLCAVVLTVALVSVIDLQGTTSTASAEFTSAQLSSAPNPPAGTTRATTDGQHADERAQGQQQRQRAEIDAQLQQMWTSVKQQNLQQWLHQLWADCKSQGPLYCDEHLTAMRRQLSNTDADWLQQLLAQYQDYQLLLGELVMDNSLSKAEQYNEVKRLRQRLFVDDYDNVFGLEEQWAMQQFELSALLQQRSQLDGAQRLEALYTQQQNQSQSVKQLQSADLLYQQAKDMLADLPTEEHQYYLAKAREHYFGADAAVVAEFEAIQHQQEQHRLSYLQQVDILQQQYQLERQKLIANNASPAQLIRSEQSYASALAQLRQQYFEP